MTTLRACSVARTVGLCVVPQLGEALLQAVNAGCPRLCVRGKGRFLTSGRRRCVLLFGGCRQGQLMERSDHSSW